MAIGKSHRIVIEVDPDLKEQIYLSLQSRGLTLKRWFLEQVHQNLGISDSNTSKIENAVRTKNVKE